MDRNLKVGVIGAGTMGQGIALTFAMNAGYEVVLCDISKETAEKGKNSIKETLSRRLKVNDSEAVKILVNITTGIVKDCGECGLIVEAVAERMDIKRALFKELDQICNKDTIFATNTSSLSITEMSGGLKHTVIGMHFFNPVPAMKLVEVVRGAHTSSEVVDQVRDIVKSIGKELVEVSEAPGFVVNRILIPMINEAIGVFASGTASAEDIDTAMKLGANHPMGPLALGDLVGLDVCLSIMEVLQEETGDPKYRPEPLLRKMVRAGLLGRKSKEGFFKYS